MLSWIDEYLMNNIKLLNQISTIAIVTMMHCTKESTQLKQLRNIISQLEAYILCYEKTHRLINFEDKCLPAVNSLPISKC